MFLVGLTGGIATGKSTVATILRNMGIEIIDADLVAREVVEPGKRAWGRIRKEFGESVFHNDGTLNREALGQIVFSEPEKRHSLNSITHPEIYKSILFKCIKLFFCGNQFAVIDLPLLYESGKMVKYLHKNIVVVCEPSQQLERLMNRNKLSESEALMRINAQMSLAEKAKRADFVINNNTSKEDTQRQVEDVVKKLRRLNTHLKYRFIVVGSILLTMTALTVGPYTLYMYFK